SDEMHLTQFGGSKKAWPVYITLGNIPSTIRNKPSNHAWVPIAFLPILPKTDKLRAKDKVHLKDQHNNLVQATLQRLLDDISKHSTFGKEINCAGFKRRRVHPIPCGWIADYMEACSIFSIKKNGCPKCHISP